MSNTSGEFRSPSFASLFLAHMGSFWAGFFGRPIERSPEWIEEKRRIEEARINKQFGMEEISSPFSATLNHCLFCQEPIPEENVFCSPECEALFQTTYQLIDE